LKIAQNKTTCKFDFTEQQLNVNFNKRKFILQPKALITLSQPQNGLGKA
jgi:hypothetical protein